jgi:hypothetical protein
LPETAPGLGKDSGILISPIIALPFLYRPTGIVHGS